MLILTFFILISNIICFRVATTYVKAGYVLNIDLL